MNIYDWQGGVTTYEAVLGAVTMIRISGSGRVCEPIANNLTADRRKDVAPFIVNLTWLWAC